MKVRRLKQDEISESLGLVWRVFCRYEAVSYPESIKAAFWQAIHSEDYLNMLTAYGAFDDSNQLTGIIATRNEGTHIALFFVDGDYQGQGIGRKLWNTMLDDNANNKNLFILRSKLFRYMLSLDLSKQGIFKPRMEFLYTNGF